MQTQDGMYKYTYLAYVCMFMYVCVYTYPYKYIQYHLIEYYMNAVVTSINLFVPAMYVLRRNVNIS